MPELLTNFDQLVEKLREKGKVTEMGQEERNVILSGIEADLEEFRIEGQRKQQDSLVEMSSLILTA
ncbi:MAG TPA: hypothetical protein VFE53_06035 [Mucilaginibacter sp.]|jgi:hypothetical protein|nr:hypothetical protein [Mucilaginibacter sp.]